MIRDLKEPTDILCIYHGNCADGFTGAWVINNWAKQHNHAVEFHPGKYNDYLPPVNNRHVIFVDFSTSREELIKMSRFSKSITILDHHKSAEENLSHLEPELQCPSEIIFDMDRAGCEIAADYFFPEESHPSVLHNIADRDLWKFEMKHTKQVSSAVFAIDQTFENWDKLMDQMNYEKIISDGKAIERKHTKDMLALYDGFMVIRDIEVDGKLFTIPTFNVPYMYASELGHHAMNTLDIPFALTWFIDKDNEYKYSFRSTNDKEDVSAVAKFFGGGGHRNASGASSIEPIWNH